MKKNTKDNLIFNSSITITTFIVDFFLNALMLGIQEKVFIFLFATGFLLLVSSLYAISEVESRTLQEKYPHRLLPSFILVGWPKTGSTSVASYLANHPQIIFDINKKEPNFLGFQHISESDYALQFPDCQIVNCTNKMTFDGTIGLVGTAEGSTHAHTYLPNAKLVFIVRNPVDRSYSRFRMAYRKELSPTLLVRHFNAAVNQTVYELQSFLKEFEKERKRTVPPIDIWTYQKKYDNHLPFKGDNRYFTTSLYYYLMEPYLRKYPRSKIHIMSTYRLQTDPKFEMNKLYKFLGLKSQQLDWDSLKKNIHPAKDDMDPKTRKQLTNFFRRYNRIFETLMDGKFDLER